MASQPKTLPADYLGQHARALERRDVAAGLVCSVRLFAGRRRYRRFNLRRELLEMLKKLPGRNSGKNKPSGHYTMWDRRVCSDALVKMGACKSDRDIPVYCANAYYLTRK